MKEQIDSKCKMPTEDWINTKDYKEKNFNRTALVVNPAKACQPLGAILAACGFEGTLPYVHGSQGCAAYFRNNLTRHFREPISAVSDSMTEDAAVFGGQGNITEGLRNSYAVYKPEMIAICTTCMAEVIGDDMTSYIENARNKKVIPEDFPVPYANTPSFVGSHITGYDNMLKGILTYLTKGVEPKLKDKNKKINIIPGFDTHIGNLREVKKIFRQFKADFTIFADNEEYLDSPQTGEFNMYPGGTPLKEVRDAPNNSATIALQRYSTKKTMKFIETAWQQEAVSLPMPIGVKATDKFIMEISRITGIEIPEELENERGRAVDSMTDAHQYIHGKRFAVYGDPDIVIGIVSFLLDMGGEPAHVLCTNASKKFAKEVEGILESSPFGKGGKVYAGKDLWHLRSLLMTEPVDMLIGTSYGKFAARDAGIPLVRIGYPIVDRVNLHRYATIGYQGVINLISWIANSFLEETDRLSDDAHFELMR